MCVFSLYIALYSKFMYKKIRSFSRALVIYFVIVKHTFKREQYINISITLYILVLQNITNIFIILPLRKNAFVLYTIYAMYITNIVTSGLCTSFISNDLSLCLCARARQTCSHILSRSICDAYIRVARSFLWFFFILSFSVGMHHVQYIFFNGRILFIYLCIPICLLRVVRAHKSLLFVHSQ